LEKLDKKSGKKTEKKKNDKEKFKKIDGDNQLQSAIDILKALIIIKK
jgi:hypothetical protein